MTQQSFSTIFTVITLKRENRSWHLYYFQGLTAQAPPPLPAAIIKCTYIEEQGVVDGQGQFYMAKVPGAVAEVLHAGCTHFFGVRRAQGQVIEPVHGRVPHVVQVLRVCYGLHTQLPGVERVKN